MEDALCFPEWDKGTRADKREALPRAGAGLWLELGPGLGVGKETVQSQGTSEEMEPAGCRNVREKSVNRTRNSQMNWRLIESMVHAAIL